MAHLKRVLETKEKHFIPIEKFSSPANFLICHAYFHELRKRRAPLPLKILLHHHPLPGTIFRYCIRLRTLVSKVHIIIDGTLNLLRLLVRALNDPLKPYTECTTRYTLFGYGQEGGGMVKFSPTNKNY